jgi:hypothetical protein
MKKERHMSLEKVVNQKRVPLQKDMIHKGKRWLKNFGELTSRIHFKPQHALNKAPEKPSQLV